MATSNFTEEEILFRRRARRRLVGAVVLVVTVIAVVPMILPENKPQQDTQQIEIRIPAQDASGYAPKVTPAPSPNPVSGTASNSDSAMSQPAIVDTNPPAPLPAAPVSDLVPRPASTEKPSVAATTPTQPKEPVKPSVAAKPNTPSKANAAAKPSYFVQYGAFSELKNAKQRQAELKTKGVTTFTEVTTTAAGDKIRVRSGPYSGREDAEKVRLKVKPLDSKLVVTDNNP